MFTLLKNPYFLDKCDDQKVYRDTEQDEITTDTPDAIIFYCVEVFNIRIFGMTFIMFLISNYFDLMNSEEYLDNINYFTKQALLKARMISKAMAYRLNHKKYQEMLKVQEQKNLFLQIQSSIMEKLKT